MYQDQASTLRKLAGRRPPPRPMITRPTRVISITSGKGGVGKTNISLNLAYALAGLGQQVFVLDADLGLANIDVLLNLSPAFTMEHVLSGEKTINDIIITGPNQIKILPSSSGIHEMADLDQEDQSRLFRSLEQINQQMDYLLIDTGAGIASNVLRFNAAANELLVVVTPEPTSMTDAYSLIKVLATHYKVRNFSLISNSVISQQEGKAVFDRLHKVVSDFLGIQINYAGFVFKDPSLERAVRSQKLLLELYPNAPASRCITHLAQNLHQKAEMIPKADPNEPGFVSFWDRLLHWKKKRLI